MSYAGERIARRRKALGISQEELAAAIGTNQKQISRYENGHNAPTAEVLVAMARSLDTTTDWLLGLSDFEERPLRGENDLNEDERELIRIYRSKPPSKRRQVVDIARVV
jgi:transcriptional regulator with XRE-family HTH domain